MNVLAPTASELSGALELLAAFSNPAVVKKALDETAKAVKDLETKRIAVDKASLEAKQSVASAQALSEEATRLTAQASESIDRYSKLQSELALAQVQFEREREAWEKRMTEENSTLISKQTEVQQRLETVVQRELAVEAREGAIADKETAARLQQDLYEKKLAGLRAVVN